MQLLQTCTLRLQFKQPSVTHFKHLSSTLVKLAGQFCTHVLFNSAKLLTHLEQVLLSEQILQFVKHFSHFPVEVFLKKVSGHVDSHVLSPKRKFPVLHSVHEEVLGQDLQFETLHF